MINFLEQNTSLNTKPNDEEPKDLITSVKLYNEAKESKGDEKEIVSIRRLYTQSLPFKDDRHGIYCRREIQFSPFESASRISRVIS